MAALFDTSVGVLLLRRSPPAPAAALIEMARTEIAAGTALLPATAVSELLLGEKSAEGLGALSTRLRRVPIAILSREAAEYAGTMGAYLQSRGAPIPLPDLLIAATALWLEIPLLAWDADYPTAHRTARDDQVDHLGAELWRKLRIHPASLGA